MAIPDFFQRLFSFFSGGLVAVFVAIFSFILICSKQQIKPKPTNQASFTPFTDFQTGAPCENRTHLSTLGRSHSTDKLKAHEIYINTNKTQRPILFFGAKTKNFKSASRKARSREKSACGEKVFMGGAASCRSIFVIFFRKLKAPTARQN